MNRLTLRISIGLLAAVVVATLAVQVFMSWQANRAFEAARIVSEQMMCVDLDGMPDEARIGLEDTLAKAGIHLPRSAGSHLVSISRDVPPTRGMVTLGPLLGPPMEWTSVLMLLAGVVVFVMGVATFLTRPALKRLQQLDAVAGRIAAGDLDARVPVSGHDPITEFALRFNQMAERNQRLLEGQRHLLQAVSHELRTPAARIRFGIEMMRDASDDAARERYRDGIDADVDEIDALVEELLALNRLDNAGTTIEMQPIDVVAVVHEECATLATLRPGIEMVLPALEGDPCVVHGSERLFRRVIRNLVGNALRHARQRVVVTLMSQDDDMRLCIDDDGPGVPVADRARIFEPFTRLDQSRSRESGGFGLGLAIVERIVMAHRGSLAVEDAPGGGARFSLGWPVDTVEGKPP